MDEQEKKKWKQKWNDQKHHTKGRKDKLGNEIEFKLSFDEWLQIWLESGHLHERGRRKGQYVMARINDVGHYEVANVEIKTSTENNTDKTFTDEARAKISASMSAAARNRSPETRAKMSAANKGKKRQKLTCPHCGITCAANNYAKYHGENCKSKVP